MSRISSVPKKKPSPPRAAAKASSQADSDQLDFGDLTLGIVAAVVMPVLVAILLGIVGMPVGGSGGFNADQAQQFRDVRGYTPPMTIKEAQIILQRVQFWVDDRAAEFIRRSRSTDAAQEKNYWQGIAIGVLGEAADDLSRVLDATALDLEIKTLVRGATQEWISKIDKLRFELDQEDPFRQIR